MRSRISSIKSGRDCFCDSSTIRKLLMLVCGMLMAALPCEANENSRPGRTAIPDVTAQKHIAAFVVSKRILNTELKSRYSASMNSFNPLQDAFEKYGFDFNHENSGITMMGTIGTAGPNTNNVQQKNEKTIFEITFPAEKVSRADVTYALTKLKTPGNIAIEAVSVRSFVDPKSTTLGEILELANSLRDHAKVRLLSYRLYAERRVKGKISKTTWGEVFSEVSSNKLIADLYDKAAYLEHDKIQKDKFLGLSALYRGQWDEAWCRFETIYAMKRNDYQLTKSITDIYRTTTGRDLELCIWLSRLMRLAPNWSDFENAYVERESIEAKYDLEAAKNEKSIDMPWSASLMPLRVYLSEANTDGSGSSLREVFYKCIQQWMLASGNKISIVETKSPENANIICQWGKPPVSYAEFEGLKKAPIGTPHQDRLGLTHYVHQNGRAASATITIYTSGPGQMQKLDDDAMTACCLHELGHALGINKHLMQENSVMYFQGDLLRPITELTVNDKLKIQKLYRELPVINQSSIIAAGSTKDSTQGFFTEFRSDAFMKHRPYSLPWLDIFEPELY